MGIHHTVTESTMQRIGTSESRRECSAAEMCPTSVSEITTGNKPVSYMYWPIFLPVPINSARSLCGS